MSTPKKVPTEDELAQLEEVKERLLGLRNRMLLDPRHRGACATVDPDLFFPERGVSAKAAKAVCAGCPVQGDCLEYALEAHEYYGVWGGMTAEDRDRERRFRRSATSNPGWRVDQESCKQGHLYDALNTRVDPKTGHRICRACQAEAKARLRARRAS